MSSCRLLLFATLVAAGTLSCRPAPERDASADKPALERDPSADKHTISKVGERELSALNAGDIDGNLATLTTDVVMMSPNEPVINGAAGVRAWLREAHDQATFNLRYTESHVVVAGDWAVERYVAAGTITPKKGGKPTEERAKGIHIYQRQPDGGWLIAQDIWNSDSPPPAQP